MKKILICAAAAGLLAPSFAAGAMRASFECRGIGTGKHAQGMTEAQCRKMGGTIVPKKGEQPFSCKGIGKGKQVKGMTKDGCVKAGGTVVPQG